MTKLKIVNKQQEKQQNKNIIFGAQKNEWCSQKRETVKPSLIGLRKPHTLFHTTWHYYRLSLRYDLLIVDVRLHEFSGRILS